jgi:GTP-binding protein HflX
MIDRPQGGERALLVHIQFPAGNMQEDLAEFEELARSAGADIVGIVTATRSQPDPRLFIGSGKAEEIRQQIQETETQLVLFNHALSPAQERNLEKELKCRVLDRTGLILDIFAQRARSFEGKLQVELALLKHMSTRLVRGWTHLERQKGGIGLRGGPGETQLEIDRRLLRRKIKYITERLEKVREQRKQGRRSRKRAVVPTVALVGYTNAGKSTLFNRLTGADVYIADRLFATLDPTLRRVELPEIGPIILADTVGFIRHLPHDLVEAFQATLEEVAEADLLLHVVDASDERRQENILEVNAVLTSIDADTVPTVLVYNKIDLCDQLDPGLDRNAESEVRRVRVSAQENLGMAELQKAIAELLGKDIVQRAFILTPKEGRLRAELYRLKALVSEHVDDEGNHHVVVRLPKADLERLFQDNESSI